MAMVQVAGGTGLLGREVAPRLQADGHEVAVLTRRPAAPLPDGVRRLVGDLAAGRGLEMTVQGADVIVHLASRPFRPARVDVAGTMARSTRSGTTAPGRTCSMSPSSAWTA